jgi:hypothetical protein
MRFISNLSAKILLFSALLKLKNDQEFKWGNEQQKAFDEIKEHMMSTSFSSSLEGEAF